MAIAPLSLKTRILKAEVIERLMYGGVTWTPLSAKHVAGPRTVHHQLLPRVAGFRRRQRTDRTTLSYAKTLKRHDAKASKRPSLSGGASLQGAWCGKTRHDCPVG